MAVAATEFAEWCDEQNRNRTFGERPDGWAGLGVRKSTDEEKVTMAVPHGMRFEIPFEVMFPQGAYLMGDRPDEDRHEGCEPGI